MIISEERAFTESFSHLTEIPKYRVEPLSCGSKLLNGLGGAHLKYVVYNIVL